MTVRTPLTQRLGIDVPVIQAPMGGGPTTPELVSEVCEAGGLGSVAGGYLTPDALESDIAAVRRLTSRPFAVNVFAPHDAEVTESEVEAALERLAPYLDELGLDPPELPTSTSPDLDGQLQVLLDTRPDVVSFTFGLIPASAVDALHHHGAVLIGTATSVAEAHALAAAGVDVVCAQGIEAGAHRGTFATPADQAAIGLTALVPAIRAAVDLPVVAAGGLMDGAAIAAVLTLGADAAQLGTAFLLCPEAGTHPTHRDAIRDAAAESTVITTALTGRPARSITNRIIDELGDAPVPPYPVMNALTSALRRAAMDQGRADLTSLWAGQGVAKATETPARELVRRLAEQTSDTIDRLAGLHP
jgi:nitronate monooxygenase